MWGYLRDRRGKGPGRNADTVILASDAQVIADATDIGDGGSIIVYGTETAEIDGTLMARGGPHGGDGGFIETSAAGRLEIAGIRVDASAPDGEPGTWLIDPTDITIDFTKANNIAAALEGGSSVEVKTDGTGTPQYGTVTNPNGAGNITVVANIQPNLAGSGEVTLTLVADNDVTINSGVTIGPASATGGDRMGVTIIAENDIKFLQSPSKIPGTIDVSAGAGGAVNLTAANDIDLGRINAGTGNISITATGGKISDNTAGEGADNENLVGGAVNLTAGTGIGGATAGHDIDIAADSLDATVTGSGGGGIFISETGNLALGRVDAGTRDIVLTAGDAITDQDTTAEGVGNENLVGGAISLTAGGSIGASGDDAIDTTVTTKLDAQAAGDIHIDETSDLPLGRLDAGTNAIVFTAGGAITDKDTTAEGANLVGGAITLAAGTGIGGATAAADIDTATANISADTTDGGIDIANTLTANTTVTSLTSANVTGSANGDIRFAQSGGGTVTFGTVTTDAGAITLTNDTAGITLSGPVTVGGTNTVQITAMDASRGNINGEGLVTAATVDLDAGTGIGNTTALELAATTISADTTDGSIDIDNTLAADVTVTSLTSTNPAGNASGAIQFDQSGGGAVDFTTVTTNDGAIALTNTNAGLSVTGSVEAGGTGKNLTLTTINSGDIVLTGTTMATDDTVFITSAGAIDGSGQLTAATANLNAATGIGDTTVLELAATKISADTTDGGINIDNTLDSEVTVSSLTSTNATGSASGDIRFAQSGGGAVTFGPVTTDAGAVTLTNDAAGLGVTGPITAGGAGNAVDLDAAGLLHIAAAVSGSRVELTGDTGIGHTANGEVTATSGGITAGATTGDISMADGTVYRTTGGDVTLTAANNVNLGRVDAGGNAISVTATGGKISDNTMAEGTDNENLVGREIVLRAGSGIGAVGEATDIDTKMADRIDARITGPTGDVAIAETGAVRLGDTVLVTPGTGRSIQVSGSTMTIDQAVTTTGSGTIRLATTIGDLQVNRAVTAGGGLNLDAAGLLNVAAAASGSSVELTGGTGIAHTAAGSVTSTSGAITATATTGDIGMANGTVYRARGAISLTAQRDVALGRVEAGANPIRVTATTGSISDITGAESENLVGGAITLQAATGIGEPGGNADIDTAADRIDAQTTSGGIFIDETDAVQLGNTGSITTGNGGGNIEVNAGGTMTVAQAVTTAGGGSISLTTTAGDLQIGQAVTAGGDLDLEAAGLLHIAAAVSGSSVGLTGGTGITHTADGDVTSHGTITATASANNISMADGTVYDAGGALDLTAQGNVALGRIEAGANPITVTATTGAISDITETEGAGNENLVGGDIGLTAATGIGEPGGVADIDTAVTKHRRANHYRP